MRILVLSTVYPSSTNPYAMAYVHTRNVAYAALGVAVDVCSMSTLYEYEHEGIKVYPPSGIEMNDYDVIAVHAINLRQHALKLLGIRRKRIVLFFHGHEVLRTVGDYPAPYDWVRKDRFVRFKAIYDEIKLITLPRILKYISQRNVVSTVFVSEWMRNRFIENMRAEPSILGSSRIIHNAASQCFYDSQYEPLEAYDADFVTIRPLDIAKYSIDLVVQVALLNPDKKFHIYGRGSFFAHVRQPDNVTWFDQFIQQVDLPKTLNRYRVALMPTRYDAQGVSVCEMAVYGMPVITSNISICREMLSGFDNVIYAENTPESLSNVVTGAIPAPYFNKSIKFDPRETARAELNLFREGI